MPKNIAVLISGGGTNLQALIDAVQTGQIDASIELVISNKGSAYGLERARVNGIDAMYVDRTQYSSDLEFDNFIMSELKHRRVDLVVLAGYLRILSPEFIEAYKYRIINIHPSLIPSFCGAGFYGIKVHEAVIEKGVKYSGATTHFVDSGIDTGCIIEQGICRVDQGDNAQALASRVLEIEHEILVRTVAAFCDDRIVIIGNRAYIREVDNG